MRDFALEEAIRQHPEEDYLQLVRRLEYRARHLLWRSCWNNLYHWRSRIILVSLLFLTLVALAKLGHL